MISQLVEKGLSIFGGIAEKETIWASNDGSRNKIFFYKNLEQDYVLRISDRYDRTLEQIEAEVNFINFLADNGLSVARPVLSENNNFVEKIMIGKSIFFITSFEKAPGQKLSEQGYKYRSGISLDEYFFNYGALLGRMHRLSKEYQSLYQHVCRPEWLEIRTKQRITCFIPDSFSKVKGKCYELWDQIRELPINTDAYGLIHADFNDSNFNIDFSTGKIVVYDFDDSCYCWFMYELANAWRMGTGWIKYEESVSKRKVFMEHYFEVVMKGYSTENNLSWEWMQKLDLFIKMVEIEKLLDEMEYMYEHSGKINYDSYLLSLFHRIEQDIPWFGFYEKKSKSQSIKYIK